MHEGSWLESSDALGQGTSATGLEHSWFEVPFGSRESGDATVFFTGTTL